MMKYFNCLVNEIKMELTVYFQNKAAVISDFLIYTLLYAFFILFQTGASLADTYSTEKGLSTLLLFVGYIIWMLSTSALTSISSEIMVEVNNGFLFSKMMAIVPLQFLYLGKVIALLVIHLMNIVPILIITVLFFDFPTISAAQLFKILFVNLMNIVGMYGLGLILSSLTIVNKKLSRISFLISTVLLFTTNALTYNEQVDKVLKYFPANYCIGYTRSVIANSTYAPKDITIFLIICVVLVICGTFVFSSATRKAKKIGNVLWY